MDFALNKRPFRTARRDCGELVRLIRNETVGEFAKSLGVSTSMISSFEAERTDSERLQKEYSRMYDEYGLWMLLSSINTKRRKLNSEEVL